jgi:hypothetical protein
LKNPAGFGFYSKKLCLIFATLLFGKWRSPVAHLYGVQGVASSNLVFPTNLKKPLVKARGFFVGEWASLQKISGAHLVVLTELIMFSQRKKALAAKRSEKPKNIYCKLN